MLRTFDGNFPRIAVIDIGTNSINLAVMGMDAMGKLLTIDREKVVLRLGEALNPEDNLPPESRQAISNALRLLQEIAQCYQPILRVVATQALRSAKNHQQLQQEIHEQLGLTIEIIDGREEARLVALGMNYAASLQEKAFFGADVGGGSTELFQVVKGRIAEGTSLTLGAVTLNHRFLKAGTSASQNLRAAEEHISQMLTPLADSLRPHPDNTVLLSSSAGKTLVEIAGGSGSSQLNELHGATLTATTIDSLYRQIAALATPENICQQWDLPLQKAEVLLAGTCILHHLTQHLRIKCWTISTYGLREGLIIDLFEQFGFREQIKRHTQQIAWFNVQSLSRQLLVDQIQAQRVSDLAIELYDQLAICQALPADLDGGENLRKLLRAAAWLHECGKLVHFTRYHRHSHYLIINSQLMGFTEREKHFISLIARYHRKGRISRKDLDFRILDQCDLKKINLLAALLRLAVAAQRSRRGEVKSIAVQQHDQGLTLAIKGRRLTPVSLDFQKILCDKDSLEQSLGLQITCKLKTGRLVEERKS